MFRCLTEGVDGGRDLRRPQRVRELADACGVGADTITEMVTAFRSPSCCFLVPPDPEPLQPETMIDISHESLIRQWGRLKAWTAEEREWATDYRRLADRARRWQEMG